MAPWLQLAGVVRRFGAIEALKGIDLALAADEMLVVLGPTGAGKTTLLRTVAGLETPDAGSIEMGGEDVTYCPPAERDVAFVFQNFALLPHRTVIDNIAFPLEVQGVNRAKRHERAREIIELVGLTGRERYYPRELSGGQQQRVGIARSLAVKPDIWFLDEPFSALDPLIRREMQDEFLRLQNLLKKTIVFITHDFDEAFAARCGLNHQIGAEASGFEIDAGAKAGQVGEGGGGQHVDGGVIGKAAFHHDLADIEDGLFSLERIHTFEADFLRARCCQLYRAPDGLGKTRVRIA